MTANKRAVRRYFLRQEQSDTQVGSERVGGFHGKSRKTREKRTWNETIGHWGPQAGNGHSLGRERLA